MKNKILIVDDEPSNLRVLERLFRRTYEVFLADSGAEGLRLLELHNIALIISDQRMPGMTGIHFLMQAAEIRPQTVRILLTGYTDVNDLVEAINSSVIYKYVTKPWINEDLQQTVLRCLEHYEAIKDHHDLRQQTARLIGESEIAIEGFLNVISEALRAKDAKHPQRCGRILAHATALAEWIDLDARDIRQLSRAVRLAEIGLLSLSEEKSENGDCEHMEMSTVFWAGHLEDIPELMDVATTIRFQHEFYDGSGFPGRLAGEQIPLHARILSLAAYYDKTAEEKTDELALEAVGEESGKRFDPRLVEAFRIVRSMDTAAFAKPAVEFNELDLASK